MCSLVHNIYFRHFIILEIHLSMVQWFLRLVILNLNVIPSNFKELLQCLIGKRNTEVKSIESYFLDSVKTITMVS